MQKFPKLNAGDKKIVKNSGSQINPGAVHSESIDSEVITDRSGFTIETKLEENQDNMTIDEREYLVADDHASMSEPSTSAYSRRRLLLLVAAMCGIQVCYAVQIGHGSATLELLGMPTRWVSVAWLAGPLSGLIVQPLVGVLSDACKSPLGRRRPFLLSGCVLTTIALLLFSNSSSIGMYLGDSVLPQEAKTESNTGTEIGLAIGVFSFFLLDFSIQAIQGPLRALITDVLPPQQHPQGNSYLALMVGAGNLVGSWLGSLNLYRYFPFFRDNVQILFALAALVLCVAVSITVVSVKEESTEDNTDGTLNQNQTPRTSLNEAWTLMRNAPRPFWQVFIVQFFSWYGFFTLFVYTSIWVGRNVYLGDSGVQATSDQRDLYAEGVRLGNIGLSASALLTIIYASQLPSLVEYFGEGKMFFFSLLVEGAALSSLVFLRGERGQQSPSYFLRVATVFNLGVLGISWASSMSIPWSLIGEAVQRTNPEQVGLFTTIFNASQSGPQMLVSFISPFIVKLTNDVSFVMLSGGLMAFTGALLAVYLKVGFAKQSHEYRQANGAA